MNKQGVAAVLSLVVPGVGQIYTASFCAARFGWS